MKKFQFLYILAILLPYCLSAMNMQRMLRTPSRLEFQKRSCSGYNSQKSLGKLSFYEVNKLAQNKELAQKEFKSALARHEDTKAISVSDEQSSDAKSLWKKIFRQFSTKTVSASDEQSTEVKSAWKKVFAQFSIQDWNSMLLEREENNILKGIHLKLPDFIKTINFEELKNTHPEIDDELRSNHELTLKSNTLLNESLQKYYQKSLEDAGYPKIQNSIYHCKFDDNGIAFCRHPSYICVTSEFFDLSLDEQLGILAHENEHLASFHQLKKISVTSFLEEQNIPKKTDLCSFFLRKQEMPKQISLRSLEKQNIPNIYSQFTEKEADLKASAHSIAIATGLLHYLKSCKEELKKQYYFSEPLEGRHPRLSKRINYIQDLINKLEQEQKEYSWNPFHKTLGLAEWFKK